MPKSTSLRVSRLGYYSEEQDENFITFNSLKGYLGTIKDYINIPNEKFKNISLDLKQQVNLLIHLIVLIKKLLLNILPLINH